MLSLEQPSKRSGQAGTLLLETAVFSGFMLNIFVSNGRPPKKYLGKTTYVYQHQNDVKRVDREVFHHFFGDPRSWALGVPPLISSI